MNNTAFQVRRIDLVEGLSRTLDLISPLVADHHLRVGCLSACLARTLGLDVEEQRDVLFAGLMHDIGALSLGNRLDAISFDAHDNKHAEAGWLLLRNRPGLDNVASLVRHHHTKYKDLPLHADAPVASNIIDLADRVDVLVRRGRPLPEQTDRIFGRVRKLAGTIFDPRYVEALGDLFQDNDALRQCATPRMYVQDLDAANRDYDNLDLDAVLEFSRLVAQIIDFRSRFTATHSRGVAVTAAALAEHIGLSPDTCRRLLLAGDLHDLGKLAVPAEILEKPAPLDDEEFTCMRTHADLTRQALADVPGLEEVCTWGSQHHERLDGSGYPNNIPGDQLPLESRIVAVADVFTAITEDRPYRAGMAPDEARATMEKQALEGFLDQDVCGVLLEQFEDIDGKRIRGQTDALEAFTTFHNEMPKGYAGGENA